MKSPHCTNCGKDGHYKTFCHSLPKKPIERSSIQRVPIKKKKGKYVDMDKEFRVAYLASHAPDEYGYYTCYLRTTQQCPVRLTVEQVTLEHVIPKGSVVGRNLRYNEDNILIACVFCNMDKGSQSLETYLKKKNKVRKICNIKK